MTYSELGGENGNKQDLHNNYMEDNDHKLDNRYTTDNSTICKPATSWVAYIESWENESKEDSEEEYIGAK